MALFASQHFNVEVGIGLRTDRWPGAEFWEQGEVPEFTLDELLDRSEAVVVGIDGGGLDDLFGLVVLGRHRATSDWLAWGPAWCPPRVLARRQTHPRPMWDVAQAAALAIAYARPADNTEKRKG